MRVKSPISIRRSLIVNLASMIVLLSAAIFGTTFFGGREAVRAVSALLIRRTLDQTESRLREFFEPARTVLRVAPEWGAAGLLAVDEPARLDELLGPVLDRNPDVSAAIVADSRGHEQMLMRLTEGRWLSRQMRRDEWGDRSLWTAWTDDDPTRVESWRDVDYDPRQRPWYVGALARRAAGAAAGAVSGIHWTEPYVFFTSGEPGMTASAAFGVPGDDLDHVIAFDILLNDISEFTIGLHPSPNGLAFVMTEQGRVIGLPRHSRLATVESRRDAILKESHKLGIAVMDDSTAAYALQVPKDREAYRFSSAGGAWWGGCRTFPLGPDLSLLIAVGVPESDLLGSLVTLRAWIIAITIGVLGAAAWRAVVLSKHYSRPIEALVAESERMSRGNLEGGPPIESRVREVRRLARAHDRMRRGLQSLMKLERDLQLARQIQERTFPQHLPVLRGFQIGAWAEPAEETGGDTYDVVGYRAATGGGAVALTAERADHAVLLLADATGHGIGPAISVTQVRAMLRMAVRSQEPLATMVGHLNDQLCGDLPEGRFVTAWFGHLDAARRVLTSFSAGQAPILVYDAKRESIDVLDADTLPLGVVRNPQIRVAAPRRIGAGDIVAVISDGIYEAAGADGEQFGTRRVCDVIVAHHREPPDRIIEILRAAVDEFTGRAPAGDDRTGIVIKG